MSTTTQTTSLDRRWLLKMIVFFVVLAGFGIWGFIDATVVYPARGEADARFQQLNYLKAAQSARRLTPEGVSVPDPAATYADLSARETVIAASGDAGALELARLKWLRSLKYMWRLTPDRTTIGDPAPRLAELEKALKSESPPKALNALDIFFQWVFVVAGLVGSLWVIAVIAAASRRKYTWDPAEHRLTLPDGLSIVPADIKEFDKRKWHKFYVTLHLTSGKEVTLDLYRYSPLEEWILQMEAIAFPPSPEAESPPESPPPEPAAA